MSLKGWHACEMTPEAGERIEAGARELYSKLSSEANRLRAIESLVRSWLPATTINTPAAWGGNLKFSCSGGSMFLPMDGAMQQIALNMAYKPPWSTSPPTSLATFPMGIFIAAFQYTLKGAAAVQLGVDPHTLQSGPLRELFGGDSWASKVKTIARSTGGNILRIWKWSSRSSDSAPRKRRASSLVHARWAIPPPLSQHPLSFYAFCGACPQLQDYDELKPSDDPSDDATVAPTIAATVTATDAATASPEVERLSDMLAELDECAEELCATRQPALKKYASVFRTGSIAYPVTSQCVRIVCAPWVTGMAGSDTNWLCFLY